MQINGARTLKRCAAASSSITAIDITASGTFSNTIDLSGIDNTFSALTSVSADGGDGADTYDINTATFPSAATMNITDTGASGSDTVNINAGSQAFTWTVKGPNNYNFQSAFGGAINFSSASGVSGGGSLANPVANGIDMVLDGGGTPTTGTTHTTTSLALLRPATPKSRLTASSLVIQAPTPTSTI